MNEIERVFSHYTKWEDWLNGMYNRRIVENEIYIGRAFRLLTNVDDFSVACRAVIDNWPISAAFNLSNYECNRNAWLGQAACCYVHKTPENLTRVAWGRMTACQRLDANKMASYFIKEWENENRKNQQKDQLELFGI